MPRIARVVAVGYPHHITQRGNYKQKIFSEDTDLKRYLSLIKAESKRYKLAILAYCFMPNHVHFIAIPKKENSLGNVFKYAHMKYSQYYNKRMSTTGHLFQGRFYSCAMNETHTSVCARYIERNPVRAGIVKKPPLYHWSSARVHCGIEKIDILGVNKLFDYIPDEQKTWKEYIDTADNYDQIEDIRKNTIKGRPLGTNSFIATLENKLNRPLRLRAKGRPKAETEKK